MKQSNHWIKDVSEVLESLSHGEKLEKFIAKSDSKIEGDVSVEIHGFITENGEFVIISEQFKRA